MTSPLASTIPPRAPEASSADPWPRCTCPAPDGCPACHGLGLILPDGWLTSSWTTTFLVPDESLGGRTPEAFLAILLAPAYPHGEGYRLLPDTHPAFAAVLGTVETELGLAHAYQRSGRAGRYLVQRKDAPAKEPWRVRHVRTVLFLQAPPLAR